MRSFATFVGLGLATVLVAQEPQQEQPILKPAAGTAGGLFQIDRYQPLEDRIGGLWQVHYNPATKTPEMIYGTGIAIPDWRENTLVEARRHADQALRTYGDLLKLGTSTFTESIGARMGNAWSFTYDQSFKGVPCVGGRADVRINRIGVIAYLGSIAYQLQPTFDVAPAIDEANAVLIAWRALGEQPTGVSQPTTDKHTRLVIWADLEAKEYQEPVLAWEVPVSNVAADGSGKIGRWYIDAKNGQPLHYTTDKHECGFADHEHHHDAATSSAPLAPVLTTVTVLAWTRTGVLATSPLANVPAVGLVLTVPGIGSVTTDANGQFTIDIAAPVTISVAQLDGTHFSPIIGSNAPTGSITVNPGVNATLQLLTNAATDLQAAHTTTAYMVHNANEWVRTIVGNSAQMNTADAVTPTVNIASACNAFYTGNTINFYSAGVSGASSCTNTAFSDVVVHEWGHGIDERYGGISNAATDGLSEGWGDTFGMYFNDNPTLGAGFFVGSTAGLRSGLNTRLYPYTGTDPHAAGELWMGFNWRLRDNLRAVLGTPTAKSITETIVIATVVANATTVPNAVTQVFIADDDNGNLADGTPHYAQLSAAATAKNLPFPVQQVASINTTPLANTTNRFTPRLVNATAAVVNSGSITDVRLVYSANGGAAVTRHMISNGAINGYQAMLPGIDTGSVTYHVEATHSSGTIVRSPATGENSYAVTAAVIGPFTGFYLENFEGAATGWTHVRVSTTGTDDWQLGLPNGKSGTGGVGFNVPWVDPSTVNSSRVYGTDLGAGTSNGSYTNNVNMYLQSPVINCSGRTGCFLRFRRWLSVEEATFDHASVYVNGILVWTNPTITHMQDTAWSTVEFAIPQADNNPSTTIRFELISDAGLVLGGWNIDDVEIGTKLLAPLPARLQMLPEQVAQNLPMQLSVLTDGPQPFLLAVGDTAGPTVIPGIPTLLVGGNTFTLTGFTNAVGLFQLGFNSLPSVPTTGLFWYSQVLTLDASTNLVVSNQHINLFTQ